jgi:hypothetical protein
LRLPDERSIITREPVAPERLAANPGCRPTSVALAVFLGALSLLSLALAASVVLVVAQFTHVGDNLAGGVGSSAQAAGQAVTRSAQATLQSIEDATDPLHPPRYAIQQDPQFDELRTLSAGDLLGDSRLYHFDVTTIEQRPDGSTPDQRLYARIHRRLIVPNVTRVLGITVRTDDQGKDFALYRGQEFAIGGHSFKVNWLSSENRQLVVVRFRRAEDAEGPLVFDEP